MKKEKLFFLSGLGASLLGLILSYLLTREYYGNAGDIVSSLCSATGEASSCETVKNSSFSGFELPLIGKLPIALFGFLFYGFLSIIQFFGLRETDTTKKTNILSVVLGISLVGLILDILLLGISAFVIKAICSLCFVTYIATALVVLFSSLNLKNIQPQQGVMQTMNQNFFPTFKSQILNYTIIVLLFFGCGLYMGRYKDNGEKLVSSEDMVKSKIDAYEKRPVQSLDLTDVPFAGDPNAPIVIVKYADYNCGHCMHASHILHQILAEFQGLVKVYYKDFPLDGNCNRLVGRKSPDGSSCIAAATAICAHKQNKFYPVYTGLFRDTENGVRHSVISAKAIIEKAGLNTQVFQACLSSPATVAYLNKEVDETEKLNIQSTPSLYVNGKALDSGTPEIEFLRKLIIHLSKK
jgi:protein-disulfide isomerase